MGALHKAHLELIRVAREHAGKDGEVAVSIFVNPLQFEPGSDYEKYPRPEKTDEEFCRNARCRSFVPTNGRGALFRGSLDLRRGSFVVECARGQIAARAFPRRMHGGREAF